MQKTNAAISTYCLRKQDEIIRKYNEIRYELIKNVYQGFKHLSQRADAIIKKNLDIEVQSEGLMSIDIGDINVDQAGISSSGSGGANYSDQDFKDQTNRGFKSAATGALIGMEVAGPVGALVGGIAGFLLGVGTHKEKHPMEEHRTSYTLDVTSLKANIRMESVTYAKNLEEQFLKQTENEIGNIRKSIKNSVSEFIHTINKYLNGLESEYEEKRLERESFIKNLRCIEDKLQSVQHRLNQIK